VVAGDGLEALFAAAEGAFTTTALGPVLGAAAVTAADCVRGGDDPRGGDTAPLGVGDLLDTRFDGARSSSSFQVLPNSSVDFFTGAAAGAGAAAAGAFFAIAAHDVFGAGAGAATGAGGTSAAAGGVTTTGTAAAGVGAAETGPGPDASDAFPRRSRGRPRWSRWSRCFGSFEECA
jgi:hypothetical protein